MKKVLQNRRGDTLVEVLVAFSLLLLFITVLGGVIGFANKMEVKAQAMRDMAYQAAEALGDASTDASHKKTIELKSGESEGFTLEINATTKTVETEDGELKFFVFEPAEEGG